MKKILAMMMCMILLCAAALAEAPGERLGLDLLKEIYTPGENAVLSPQSLALALGMAAEGARGESLALLLQELGAADASEISAHLPEGLKSANALFVKPDLELKADALARLEEHYGAQQFALEGDVVEKVNAWVREHTNALIEEMISEAPRADIGLLLINAIALDAHWASPFDSAANTMEDFHTAEGEAQAAEMMHQSEYFDYVEKDGVQVVRLPYVEGNLEMWIALPAPGETAQLLERLAQQGGADYFRSDAAAREVALSLPKFDVSDENTLSDALKLLGMEQVFSMDADFSGLSDVPLCLDEIMQKARVQVDEDGTKAAAATMASIRCTALLDAEPPVEMKVDRPFVFLIVDAESDAICFAGAIERLAQ